MPDQKKIKFFSARFPVALHEWLKEQAKQNNRSMNKELVSIIQRAMAKV